MHFSNTISIFTYVDLLPAEKLISGYLNLFN